MTNLLLGLLVANAVILFAMLLVYRRVARTSPRRRVESPNSQYKSPYVLELEARERWEALDLALLHEVNREEVERLLEQLREPGTRTLAPTERAFLDRMVEAEARVRRRAGAPPLGPVQGRQLPGTS